MNETKAVKLPEGVRARPRSSAAYFEQKHREDWRKLADGKIITVDTKEFEQLSGLRLKDWDSRLVEVKTKKRLERDVAEKKTGGEVT